MSNILIETREQLSKLAVPLHELYVPSAETIQHTEHVDLTTTTGPSGVGKNTIMSLTGIPIVISRTTREPRANDGVMEQHGVEYFFEQDYSKVYEDIKKGNYVQWSPGPNSDIYGSTADAYPFSGPALIDVVAKAIPGMRTLRGNFRSIESAYVVAESYEAYNSRFRGRGEISPQNLKSRQEEAYSSLLAGLDDDEMHFIVNDDPERAANNLTLLANRHESHDEETRARNCGYAMLRGLGGELGLPVVYSVS